jgi:hypothetical protein
MMFYMYSQWVSKWVSVMAMCEELWGICYINMAEMLLAGSLWTVKAPPVVNLHFQIFSPCEETR